MHKSIATILAALVLAAPAGAQTAPSDPASPAAGSQKAKDPNRMICEREEEIGSRLGGKKVCKTAQEWQDWRQQNRTQVEDWQRQLTSPGKPGG